MSMPEEQPTASNSLQNATVGAAVGAAVGAGHLVKLAGQPLVDEYKASSCGVQMTRAL
jgi:hypothetical protein